MEIRNSVKLAEFEDIDLHTIVFSIFYIFFFKVTAFGLFIYVHYTHCHEVVQTDVMAKAWQSDQ